MVDYTSFLWEDQFVPTKYIYPDGEDTSPKREMQLNLAPDLSDRHISANGNITLRKGPAFGVFREVFFAVCASVSVRVAFSYDISCVSVCSYFIYCIHFTSVFAARGPARLKTPPASAQGRVSCSVRAQLV